MSISAGFYRTERITLEMGKKVIESEFSDVKVRILSEGEKDEWYRFDFTYKYPSGVTEMRNICLFPNSLDYMNYGTDVDIRHEHSAFHFNAWGASDDILIRIGKHFGGYFYPNDCDDEPHTYIKSFTEIITDRNNLINSLIE